MGGGVQRDLYQSLLQGTIVLQPVLQEPVLRETAQAGSRLL